jgi:hypothetical protein
MIWYSLDCGSARSSVRKEAAMYVMLFILAAFILATLVMQTINRRQPDRIAVLIDTRKPRRRNTRF